MPFAFTDFQEGFDAVIRQTGPVPHVSRSDRELAA